MGRINIMICCQNNFTFKDTLGLKLSKDKIRCKKCWEHKGLQTKLSNINDGTNAVLFDNRIVILKKFNCKFFISSLLRSPLFQFFKERI